MIPTVLGPSREVVAFRRSSATRHSLPNRCRNQLLDAGAIAEPGTIGWSMKRAVLMLFHLEFMTVPARMHQLDAQILTSHDDRQHRSAITAIPRQYLPFAKVGTRRARYILGMGVPLAQIPY